MSHLSTDPRVSVLMTVHNAGHFVREAVDSILCQTFGSFEFIIVDDGSSDDSMAVLVPWIRSDNRVVLVQGPHVGRVAALNRGLSMARGEFLAVMDADDVSLPDRLERQVEYMDASKCVVCSSGDYELIDSSMRFLTVVHLPVDEDQIQQLALAGKTPLCHGCSIMRRAAVQVVGGYDPDFPVAQDLDLYLRLGDIGRLGNIRHRLVKVRLHQRSLSATKRELQMDRAREACRRAWQRRGIEGSFEALEYQRPGADRASRHKFALKCGWWAFNSGERWTAMIYGVKAIGLRPLSSEGWRLLACAAIKKPKAKSNA